MHSFPLFRQPFDRSNGRAHCLAICLNSRHRKHLIKALCFLNLPITQSIRNFPPASSLAASSCCRHYTVVCILVYGFLRFTTSAVVTPAVATLRLKCIDLNAFLMSCLAVTSSTSLHWTVWCCFRHLTCTSFPKKRAHCRSG